MRICRGTCFESLSRRVFKSSRGLYSLLHTRRVAARCDQRKMPNSFKRLFVWEASIDLAVRIIALSDRLVLKRRYAIADQLVRSAFSVPSNIAEGQGRLTTRDRRHFFVQARGSLYELETQLEVLRRARLAKDVSGVHALIRQISSGLTRIIDRLGDSPSTTRRPGDSTTRKRSS